MTSIKNNGFNATVVVEEKRSCIIDGHGTNNIKMLIADYKFQVGEEVEGSGAKRDYNWPSMCGSMLSGTRFRKRAPP